MLTPQDAPSQSVEARQLNRLTRRRRRVVLVDFPWTRNKDPRISLGHASLLAALTTWTSADVRSVVFPRSDPSFSVAHVVRRIQDEVRGYAPHEVDLAIGVYVWSESAVWQVLAWLRREGFAGRVILGGPQISYSGPGLEIHYPLADVFVRGYGEEALCALVESPLAGDIPGVHFAYRPDFALQAPVELERLPSPHLNGGLEPGQTFVRWETQRGCPFRCTFCQHREPGLQFIRRDFGRTRVFDEIDLFVGAGVQDIAALDPVFNVNANSVEILNRFVSRHYSGRLSLQCRPELLKPDFLDAAARLNVCVELGLQTIHPEESAAVKRVNDLVKVDDGLTQLRRRGIAHEVSLIFGLPCQTLGSFLRTVQWCLDHRVPVIRAFPLMLLRGTELERDRWRWGLVDDGTDMPMVVESASFSRAEWLVMAQVAEALLMTEDDHPLRVEDLVAIGRQLKPSFGRWQVGELSDDGADSGVAP